MYDIEHNGHHVVRIVCYSLYLSCLRPMNTCHVRENYDGGCYVSNVIACAILEASCSNTILSSKFELGP